jgi:hypothetical protein
MTGNARPAPRLIGSLRAENGKGSVRMEDRFDTGIEDVRSALTEPERLACWLGTVEGDLRVGVAICTSSTPAKPKAPATWTCAIPRTASWSPSAPTARSSTLSRPGSRPTAPRPW